MTITCADPIKSVYSPSHKMDVKRDGDADVTAAGEDEGVAAGEAVGGEGQPAGTVGPGAAEWLERLGPGEELVAGLAQQLHVVAELDAFRQCAGGGRHVAGADAREPASGGPATPDDTAARRERTARGRRGLRRTGSTPCPAGAAGRTASSGPR